jgi:hypothetical protein
LLDPHDANRHAASIETDWASLTLCGLEFHHNHNAIGTCDDPECDCTEMAAEYQRIMDYVIACVKLAEMLTGAPHV